MLFGSPKKKIERYFASNKNVSPIVVCGSFGRRSAIRALATILSQEYNVAIGVNPKLDVDIVILDYSSLTEFPDISPDVAVIVSCDNDEQAQAFFGVANRSGKVIINYNDVGQQYAKYLTNPEVVTYGDELPANYYFENHEHTIEGSKGDIVNPKNVHYPVELKIIGEHNIRPVVMAAAVARLYKIDREKVLAGVRDITPLHGRMSQAKGMRGSIIIDDSADSSERSVLSAMRAIYEIDAPSKIVVLGTPNLVPQFDMDLISEVLILGQKPEGLNFGDKVKFFDDSLGLMNHLGGRLEEGGIVLTELPMPEFIESYIW